MLTLKTYGPTELGDARKLPIGEYDLSMDFSDELYVAKIGDIVESVSLAELITHTRGAMRYFSPVTRRWVSVPENEPLLYCPDGRKGLCLAGALGAVMSGNPTSAGTATSSTEGHVNKVLPIICWGESGARITVSGNFEYIDPDKTAATPYQPLFIRLLEGSIVLSYNSLVTGYKIPQQGWDEWPSEASLFNGAAGTIATLSAGALSLVNGVGPIVEFSGKYLPHESRFPLNQTQWALQFTDGTNSFGFYLHSGTNEWRLSNNPNNARILRPTSKNPKAQDLEFKLVWDKNQNLANIWANGKLVNKGVPVPSMEALTEVSFGKNSGNATVDLRASLKYFAVRESNEVIVPWLGPSE